MAFILILVIGVSLGICSTTQVFRQVIKDTVKQILHYSNRIKELAIISIEVKNIAYFKMLRRTFKC